MTRVAVIGAGPSGLAQLHAFERASRQGVEVPEIVCFEKQSDWGGLWNYTWRAGLDEHGDPVHGSMYRYLWSNGPKECLEFADYTFDEHFGKPIPSFPPREVLVDYITGRAKKNDLRPLHPVQHRRPLDRTSTPTRGTFEVTVGDPWPTAAHAPRQFDHVIVATGHFSIPNLPEYQGSPPSPAGSCTRTTSGTRRSSPARTCWSWAAATRPRTSRCSARSTAPGSVTIAYRNAPMGFDWPEGISEVPLLTKVDGQHGPLRGRHQPRMSTRSCCAPATGTSSRSSRTACGCAPATCSTRPTSTRACSGLDNPTLMYLGMQDQYYTFTMFDAQALVRPRLVLGRVALPSRDRDGRRTSRRGASGRRP